MESPEEQKNADKDRKALQQELRRKEILRRLRLVDPSSYAFYVDAVKLLEEEDETSLHSLSHIVAHLLRELEGAMRDALGPTTLTKPEWPEDRVTSVVSAVQGALVELQIDQSDPLHQSIAQAVTRRAMTSHAWHIHATLDFLGIGLEDPVRKQWIELVSGNGTRLAYLAHRQALEGPRKMGDRLHQLMETIDSILDVVLKRFEECFALYLKRVDDLHAITSPTVHDVDVLKTRLPNNPVIRERFFRHLDNPAWLQPLMRRKVFANIPSPIETEEGLAFPGWLPVFALQRLSKIREARNVVGSILMSLDATSNDWVNGHLMDVALNLPTAVAAKWVTREADRIENAESLYLWLPNSCRKMVDRMATEGKHDVAYALATSVLRLRAMLDPEPSLEESLAKALEAKIEGERKTTVMKVSQHEYAEMAKAVVEKIAPRLPMDVVGMFTTLMEVSLENDGYSKEAPVDHSHVRRDWIGESEDHYAREAHLLLVSPLRDVALKLAENPEQRREVLEFLVQREWQVFWRIALHVGAKVLAPGSPEIQWLLEVRPWFEYWHDLPEYYELLRAAFAKMTDAERSKSLDWAGDLPRRSVWMERFVERYGREATAEEIKDYEANRGVHALWRIRDVLPPEWAAKFEKWQERKTGQEAALMEQAPKGVHRVDGPKTKAELAAMEVEDVLQFLHDWIPDDSFWSTTRNAGALSMALKGDIQRRPGEYFAARQRFLALEDPMWCSALLDGIRDGEWEALDWGELISFMESLVDWGPDKKSPKAGKYPQSDFSTDARRMRMGVLELLKQGLEASEDDPGLPYEHASAVWSILKKLLDDPDPDQDSYPTRNGNPDYAQTAINCIRSEALQAVIHYGVWWVFQNYKTRAKRVERANNRSTMEEIPGLVEVLDHHLRDDEHPAVWAVYGFSLVMLIWLGRDWVEENLSRLFPDDESPPMRHEAVWTTFIRFYRSNFIANKVLRGQFVKETAKLTDKAVDKDDHRTARAWDRLAIHLMIMFWWGEVDLDEEPVSTFFRQASDELRAHAIDYLGNQYSRFLRGGNGENDPTDRLMELWVERNKRAAAAEGRGFGQEMGAFLSFFAAGGPIPTHIVLDPEQDQGEYTPGVKPAFRGDSEWVLNRLIDGLKWAKGSTWMHDTELARKFFNFADDELQGKAIKALRMLVESNRQDFGLSFWIRDAEALIKSAAKAEGRESREECYRLINILGSVGIDDYRALLPVERGGIPAEQSDQVKAEAATKLPAKDCKPKSKTKKRQSSAPKGRSKQHGRAKGPSTKRRKKGR